MNLDSITLRDELQPRARIDEATWREYMFLIADGVAFPPVVVFKDDSGECWLADGYHRWHAHKAYRSTDIAADVRSGSYAEALRYSLGANALHGKRREAGDYTKGYQTALAYGLVDAVDVDAVKALLNCSTATAYELTEMARQAATEARDAEIAALKAEGKTVREIAREVGVSVGTVSNKTSDVHKFQPGKTEQQAHPAVSEIRDMLSDRGERWWAAYRALQAVNALASVDDLLADPYSGIEHAFEPALRQAHEWINELYRGYFDGERRGQDSAWHHRSATAAE